MSVQPLSDPGEELSSVPVSCPVPPEPEADLGAATGCVHRGLLPVPGRVAASPAHLEFLQVGPPTVSGRGGAGPVCPLRWGGQAPPGTGTQWWLHEKKGWEAVKGAPCGHGQVSMGPHCLPNPQASALHSQLHSHQPVHVFHASGSSHPHPRPAAASTGPRTRGPGPYPVEPGEHPPSSSQVGIPPPLGGRRFPRYSLPTTRATVSSLLTTPNAFGEGPPTQPPALFTPSSPLSECSILFLILPTTGLSHP